MVVRKRRKKNKLRGGRTQHGNTKNARGSGCRGGRGRAGSHKHKFSKYWHTFGIKQRLKSRVKKKSLNLDELSKRLQEMIEEKKVEEKDGKFFLDCKKVEVGKILGRGKIEFPLVVLNCKASKKAIEKIEKAGGMVEGVKANLNEVGEEEKEKKAKKK